MLYFKYLYLFLFFVFFTGAFGSKTFRPKMQGQKFTSAYSTITMNDKGFITSIKNNLTQKEYCPKGISSALLALEKSGEYLLPVSAKTKSSNIILTYSNGTVCTVKVVPKGSYIRFELVSLSPRHDIDNIVWGPYKTNISKYIGDMVGVVHDQDFAFGVFSLNDNTTGGLPCDGDLFQWYYYVHSTDTIKYPVPADLKEGQRFRFGGDGMSDVAMFSQPEEYFHITGGMAAQLEPSFGSSVAMHARDRRKKHLDFITMLPGYKNMNLPRHQWVDPIDADLMGSSIAMFGCPDSITLQLIEKVVINENLPHIKTNEGKWIRDMSAFRTDMAWYGKHDSLISYARQLGIRAVEDVGLNEYYPNPANRWGGKKIDFSHDSISIAEYTTQTNQYGIAYGLHTLTEFLQSFNSDVSPVPNDSLVVLYSTFLDKNITATDTIICVSDTTFLNEYGGWEGNYTNVLKLGKELIEYNGVTTKPPYTLGHVKRGHFKTVAAAHRTGDRIDKLQPNCYGGFAPNIYLQDKYAKYYGKLMVDGGMNYVDFDGLESCSYQAQGAYSYKRFFRKLFDTYHSLGGTYLRVMGSGISEGNWLYMSVNNMGGNSNMYNPVTNKWGIEGKDLRYLGLRNYLPASFGIQNFQPDWTVQVIENLQSKAVAWDGMYMLGLSQEVVEKNPQKRAIFKAFRAWEDARAANVFTDELKKQMQPEGNMYHIEQVDDQTWKLYRVLSSGNLESPVILKSKKKSGPKSA